MKLYSGPSSLFSRKVEIALGERIAFEGGMWPSRRSEATSRRIRGGGGQSQGPGAGAGGRRCQAVRIPR